MSSQNDKNNIHAEQLKGVFSDLGIGKKTMQTKVLSP